MSENTDVGARRATVAGALERLPGPGGERFAKVMGHGGGEFVNGPERHPFGPGDALFVPAGVEHRFEDFTDDLVVWVVFYGPEDGEDPKEGA